ncbi:MAG: antibiotic biosynthesis monooxygenase [Anaerolineae bacterium]|nr:antibiotic biosynthesis monooxygenase [Anaerolineae bacterium]
MYGTIARLRIRAGQERAFTAYGERQAARVDDTPGFVASYIYQMDSNPREFFLVVMFESKDAYFANANSADQNQQFMEMMQYLEAEPEWHDGEIIFASR